MGGIVSFHPSDYLVILAFSDPHVDPCSKYAKPKQVYDVVESGANNVDLIVGLGDYSGKYVKIVTSTSEENGVPYIAVIGNHDLNAQSRQKFYDAYNDLSDRERDVLLRMGYGTNFNYALPISKQPSLEYLLKSDNSGLLFRHYPIQTQRDIEHMNYILDKYNLEHLIVVSGHLHTPNWIRIKSNGKRRWIRAPGANLRDTTLGDKIVRNVVIPSLTKGDARSNSKFYTLCTLYWYLDELTVDTRRIKK
ncbi:hypothetical protein DRN75_01250 [Nanoarchaeota archaeon]|nr:MAG: hypothetical protein DRN75_01250 [Nanoarchaeota archaeon]